MIDPHSYNSARFADLRRVLTGWLNDELAQYRIIVKSLEEDLYDGHVLQKLTGASPPPGDGQCGTQAHQWCSVKGRKGCMGGTGCRS